MVNQGTVNAMGAIGGVILAVCQAPQLIKIFRTKSAADLSYIYMALYSIGLLFICIYLYLEQATVGFVCECVEFTCGLTLIGAKFYLEHIYHRRQSQQTEPAGNGVAGQTVTLHHLE